MVYICIPSNNLTLVCIWAQVSTWIRGKKSVPFSGVDGGQGEGGYSPFPIGLSTEMQNKENTMFLSFLRLLFMLEWTKKWFKASFETYIKGGGANLSKIKVTNQWKLRKMPKSKRSNLIANVKMPNIGFINKYIINSEMRGKGGRGLFSIS